MIAAEIEGKPYFVIIPEESHQLLVTLVAGISEGGKLNVVAAPEEFRISNLKDELNSSSKKDK